MGKIVEGVFAINKPTGTTSAQALRDLQYHFNPSKLFQPWLEAERTRRDRENCNQKRRRREKQVQVKIGHGGTLDPLATGVLIAGVGSGTKQLQGFLECTKTYEVVCLFGAATDTYDVDGKVVKKAPYSHITRDGVEKALGAFKGKIMQVPPIYSALKIQGKKLYEYARSGEATPKEIVARPVEVLELDVVEWLEGGSHKYQWPAEAADPEEKKQIDKALHMAEQNVRSASPAHEASKRKLSAGGHSDGRPTELESRSLKKAKTEGINTNEDSEALKDHGDSPAGLVSLQAEGTSDSPDKPPAVRLRMTVTSGFYVRSLCHDLGRALDSLALVSELTRTRQGDFELGRNVLEYDELANGEEVWGPKVEAYIEAWAEKQANR